MSVSYKIRILGASYGSLLGAKLAFAGHAVKLVCLPQEAQLINAEGARVRLPVRGLAQPIELNTKTMPGEITSDGPAAVDPADYDLVGLAMLMTGNYRCVQEREMRPTKAAVHSNIDESRTVYNWVNDLCVSLGADPGDLVPFEKYANATLSLRNPSSAARALIAGVHKIERVDCPGAGRRRCPRSAFQQRGPQRRTGRWLAREEPATGLNEIADKSSPLR